MKLRRVSVYGVLVSESGHIRCARVCARELASLIAAARAKWQVLYDGTPGVITLMTDRNHIAEMSALGLSSLSLRWAALPASFLWSARSTASWRALEGTLVCAPRLWQRVHRMASLRGWFQISTTPSTAYLWYSTQTIACRPSRRPTRGPFRVRSALKLFFARPDCQAPRLCPASRCGGVCVSFSLSLRPHTRSPLSPLSDQRLARLPPLV